MKMAVERLIPARAIAAAGIRHLGGEGAGGSALSVTINVVAASPNPLEVPASITMLPTLRTRIPMTEHRKLAKAEVAELDALNGAWSRHLAPPGRELDAQSVKPSG